MGNPTQFNGYTATWQNGKLSTLSDGYLQIYYLYNGLGRRTSKIVGGAEAIYTYDSNGNLIKEEGIQNIEYIYGANGIMGINLNGMPYVFRKNLFGDVTHILDMDGNVVGDGVSCR